MTSAVILSAAVPVISALLGVALGVILTSWSTTKRDHLILKRDVLRRVMGYRWQLARPGGSDHTVFTALNEIPVVFAGDKDVEDALSTFRARVNQGFRAEHFPPLLQAMARSARVPHERWSKNHLESPMTPSAGTGRG